MPARLTTMVLLLGLCAACVRTPPAQYYLLTASVPTAVGATDGPRIGLGPITLPEYLDRPQIVQLTTPTRLSLSDRHRWAEPLQESFARTLLAELAHALPESRLVPFPWRGEQTPTRQIVIDVQRFERGADGSLHLDARWLLLSADGDKRPRAFDSAITVPVGADADDFDAIVAAASQAVGAFAEDIARQLPAR